jgi:neutral ceramidase
MIGAVNAEIFNPIAAIEAGVAVQSDHDGNADGSARSGYIPDDASGGKYTFEVLSSRLQPGCAESSIVSGLLELIDGARRADLR